MTNGARPGKRRAPFVLVAMEEGHPPCLIRNYATCTPCRELVPVEEVTSAGRQTETDCRPGQQKHTLRCSRCQYGAQKFSEPADDDICRREQGAIKKKTHLYTLRAGALGFPRPAARVRRRGAAAKSGVAATAQSRLTPSIRPSRPNRAIELRAAMLATSSSEHPLSRRKPSRLATVHG